LFGESGGIDDQGVLPSGLGNQRNRLAVRIGPFRKLGLNETGNLRRTGEHHAVRPGIANQCRAHLAISGQQLNDARRHAGFTQDCDGQICDQWRLLGGFRQHGIAGRKRGRDLTGKDRERKIPRADAHHGPERAMGVVREALADLRSVIAQEVDRLPHLANGIRQRLSGLAHNHANQARHASLHQRGGAIEQGGALRGWCRSPAHCVVNGDCKGPIDKDGIGLFNLPNPVAAIRRIEYRPAPAACRFVADERHGAIDHACVRRQTRGEGGKHLFVAKIKPGGIFALRAIKIARKDNPLVFRSDRLERGGGRDRVG